ncbi:hypothetical protein MPTK1_2g23910 [Marchantia polymorpha subsp. ruderalis]|uniref:Uncharacterized protein n=1 Tax=Marchantia polymorpha TaxID=3197 RepID=A0A2R6WPC4_MARPO|nr:hypothetical protein MARPO_0069s0041 [Marchantia polymorpha]BBN03489.1 hypothetical protein Mp_2g23910 [Marchantia polymorpha subsp. ruderalis]|eukprot:PTQ35696.1 hypothetical protein MARPO_0069s0041 [Marchantia polymorpha]
MPQPSPTCLHCKLTDRSCGLQLAASSSLEKDHNLHLPGSLSSTSSHCTDASTCSNGHVNGQLARPVCDRILVDRQPLASRRV